MKSSFPLLASLTAAYQPARRWRRPEHGRAWRNEIMPRIHEFIRAMA